MKNKDKKLHQVMLSPKEKAHIPLGVSVIFKKSISNKQTENAVTVYSKEYKKSDLFAFSSEKPLSKIF